MTEKKTVPAVHIPREHQSAPKEHWADKEIAKAAEEIREGKFTPQVSDDEDILGAAVSLSRGTAIKNPFALTPEEKTEQQKEMHDSLALAQHPRVQEALRRLETEKREAKNSQELLEKTQMLHEMNARAAQSAMWDGQGRWLGKENEEMRTVNIMTPMDFHKQLEKVIGEKRVWLNRFAVCKRVALLVPNDAANRRKLVWTPDQGTGASLHADDKFLQVGTLQYPCGPEWMVMRFDDYGIPKNAKYLGWRTALLSMIDLKIITEKEAHKAFPLGLGPAGDWYREQLYVIRARDGVLN